MNADLAFSSENVHEQMLPVVQEAVCNVITINTVEIYQTILFDII